MEPKHNEKLIISNTCADKSVKQESTLPDLGWNFGVCDFWDWIDEDWPGEMGRLAGRFHLVVDKLPDPKY